MVERRTAQGKMLDMEALMAEHEDSVAVGNAKMNAPKAPTAADSVGVAIPE